MSMCSLLEVMRFLYLNFCLRNANISNSPHSYSKIAAKIKSIDVDFLLYLLLKILFFLFTAYIYD